MTCWNGLIHILTHSDLQFRKMQREFLHQFILVRFTSVTSVLMSQFKVVTAFQGNCELCESRFSQFDTVIPSTSHTPSRPCSDLLYNAMRGGTEAFGSQYWMNKWLLVAGLKCSSCIKTWLEINRPRRVLQGFVTMFGYKSHAFPVIPDFSVRTALEEIQWRTQRNLHSCNFMQIVLLMSCGSVIYSITLFVYSIWFS